MVTIAINNSLPLEGARADELVREACMKTSVGEYELVEFGNPFEFLDRMGSRAPLIDLLVLPYELAGVNGAQVVNELHGSCPTARCVMTAQSTAYAAEAAAVDVDEYLVTPVQSAALEEALVRQLRKITRLHASSIAMSCRDGARRIEHARILYSETSGHDQIVHLKGGSVVTGRYSSQAFFDLLGGNGRFFKAGSSYILNLDEIVEARTTGGTVTLSDGTTLTVPSRMRKPLETALLS